MKDWKLNNMTIDELYKDTEEYTMYERHNRTEREETKLFDTMRLEL